MTLCRMIIPLVFFLAVHAPTAHGEQHTGLGVTRQAVLEMMASEGLNPTNHTLPGLEGHKVTELKISKPLTTVTMYGPDDDLNTIEMTTMASTDDTETYYQGLISLWLLNNVFPDWPSSHMWFKRAAGSLADGDTKGKVHVRRNGIQAEVDTGFGYFFFNLVGLPVDTVAAAN